MLDTNGGSRNLSRRGFLNWALVGSLTAIVGQALAGLFAFFRPKLKSGEFGSWIKAGSVAEFPPGTVRHVRAGQFYIAHVEGDGLIALWHRCTHLGCTVPWNEGEGQFHCPCHSSLFDLTGQVTGGPAPRPLDRFAIEIQDEEVLVDTGVPLERSRYESSQAAKL